MIIKIYQIPRYIIFWPLFLIFFYVPKNNRFFNFSSKLVFINKIFKSILTLCLLSIKVIFVNTIINFPTTSFLFAVVVTPFLSLTTGIFTSLLSLTFLLLSFFMRSVTHLDSSFYSINLLIYKLYNNGYFLQKSSFLFLFFPYYLYNNFFVLLIFLFLYLFIMFFTIKKREGVL